MFVVLLDLLLAHPYRYMCSHISGISPIALKQ